MKKLKQIYEGWRNKMFPPKNLEEIISTTREKRLAICNSCPKHSKNFPNNNNRPDNHCTECGCTLAAKTSCLTCECPLLKWKAEMTQEQLTILKQKQNG